MNCQCMDISNEQTGCSVGCECSCHKKVDKMAHCQICEREIKNGFGLIAHHGFERKGGWQTTSCIGAREKSYEESRDIIPKAISGINAWIELQTRVLEKVQSGTIDVQSLTRGNFLHPDDIMYPIRQREEISRIQWSIKMATRDRDRLQKRYDEWKQTKRKVIKNE